MVLPELKLKQARLDEYKLARKRQPSLAELQEREKEHKEIVRKRLQELREKRIGVKRGSRNEGS